ncbi:MAG: pyrophosphohydrolase [Rickettsiaceae bacterium]|jgi:putative (di)nucleoside polyphosphate hydrolase|nr:pyrophosphohydrolase [Rickettsiaceae bacterium]
MYKEDKENKINRMNLPYREGVGMMIINQYNKIFVGKRIDTKIEAWQMPQGGIDIGETPSRAALREMHEEVGSNKGVILAESKKWYSYDLPTFLIPKLWGGKYRGQKQKWFLIKFTGTDEDINLKTAHPEFNAWKWTSLDRLPKIIVPFKRKLYQAVVEEFKDIITK